MVGSRSVTELALTIFPPSSGEGPLKCQGFFVSNLKWLFKLEGTIVSLRWVNESLDPSSPMPAGHLIFGLIDQWLNLSLGDAIELSLS